ncbi:MAG TPA: hypothetical protein VGM14_13130 [Streptosporangiaceae bacterium]
MPIAVVPGASPPPLLGVTDLTGEPEVTGPTGTDRAPGATNVMVKPKASNGQVTR